MHEILPYLVIFGIVATFVILLLGIVTMNIGGAFDRKYGNFLMRCRIGAQAITIILFIIYMVWR